MVELRRMLLGEGDDRSGAPEPSLLPYLARWVEAAALDQLLATAESVARWGAVAPPWLPLWEATLDVALRRSARLSDPLETEVRLATLGGTVADRAALAALQRRLPPSEEPPGAALWCLLAPVLPDDQLAEMVRVVAADAVPAEAARRLLVALAHFQPLDSFGDLADRLLEGSQTGEYRQARMAHLLPALPEALRPAVADELVRWATSLPLPPWYLVLVASRVAPFARSDSRWDVLDLPPPWNGLLSTLLRAAPAAEPQQDVLRAHPYAEELAAVEGIHETSVEALYGLAQWNTPVAGEDGGDDEFSFGIGGGDMPAWEDADIERERAALDVDTDRSALPSTETDARRLQIDVFAGGVEVERAFVAGVDHEVVFSIGRHARIVADTAFLEPQFPPGVDRIPLTVRLAVGDRLQEGVVQLPRDRGRDSTPWTFSLPVAPRATSASALLAVYDGLVLLQAAVIVGSVVDDLASERTFGGRIDLQVNALVRQLADAPPSGTEGSIVSDGRRLIAAHSGGAIAVDASALAEDIELLWDRVEAAAGVVLDGEDDEIIRLLRDLAFHGRGLRARFAALLPAELLGDGPLQVVAADPIAILPLELIYDGLQPTKGSKVCEGWRQSLLAGACTGCPGEIQKAEDTKHPSICPLRFWGLRRVIEHHTGLRGASGGFEVRSERTDATSALPELEGALVAASSRVAEADVEATVSAARAAFGRASRATTWEQWAELVATERPAVLVLLPHQAWDEDFSPPIRALEVSDVLLLKGGLGPDKVRWTGGPGPVVLLLGCNTGGDELPVTSFAGEFRNNGAAFVISTLVEVIADEAPRAAQVLMGALVQAQRSGGSNTVGEALLVARRALLAEGLVFALAVIGHGDPDWRMAKD